MQKQLDRRRLIGLQRRTGAMTVATRRRMKLEDPNKMIEKPCFWLLLFEACLLPVFFICFLVMAWWPLFFFQIWFFVSLNQTMFNYVGLCLFVLFVARVWLVPIPFLLLLFTGFHEF